jgi:hypothetical protein
MKRFLFLVMAFALFSGAGAGAKEETLKLPKGLFVLGTLEQAKAKAAAENKPLAFLATFEGTDDRRTIKATEAFLDAIDRRAVVVYLAKDDIRAKNLPEAVSKGLDELKRQLIVPLVVVTNESATETYFARTYANYPSAEEAGKSIKRQMRDLAAKRKKR